MKRLARSRYRCFGRLRLCRSKPAGCHRRQRFSTRRGLALLPLSRRCSTALGLVARIRVALLPVMSPAVWRPMTPSAQRHGSAAQPRYHWPFGSPALVGARGFPAAAVSSCSNAAPPLQNEQRGHRHGCCGLRSSSAPPPPPCLPAFEIQKNPASPCSLRARHTARPVPHMPWLCDGR